MESLAASERLGRYQLLEPIGAGPNGSVARAKVFGVAGFERQFAVKRIASELTASPASAQALSAAARSYGSLEHPRIARMSEFGVAQGQTFTAVELVTGLDAMRLVTDAKIGGTGLPAGGALALVSQIARAVGYAHGRGLTHLGLAPTNVIITPDGDVKVTDFGILAATLPQRPADVPRLANRLAYLAPEQIAGEAPSAATDVFALGVIGYELVTGQRAYSGDSPAAIAAAVLAGPPPDPQLPRPIVRVLQRCLARSPFERFPDARALADALDAALRVAPVPGTRKDIGAQVKATLDRLAALNEGQLSGMLAINIGTAASPEPGEVPTTEFVRPDVPVPGPAPLVGPRSAPSIPKVPTTAPGLAPPPLPPSPNATMMGVAAARRPSVPTGVPASIPSIPKVGARPSRGSEPPGSVPTVPTLADRPRAPSEIARAEGLSRALSDLSQDEPTREDAARTAPSLPRAHSEMPTNVDPHRVADELAELESGSITMIPDDRDDMETGEMSPLLAEKLTLAARTDTDTAEVAKIAADYEHEKPTRVDPMRADAEASRSRLGTDPPTFIPAPVRDPSDPVIDNSTLLAREAASSTMPGFAPPPRGQSQPPAKAPAFTAPPAPSKGSGGVVKALLIAFVVGGVAAGGYYGYTQYLAKPGAGSAVATVGSDHAGSAVVASTDHAGSAVAASTDHTGSAVAASTNHAGSAVVANAGSAVVASAGSADHAGSAAHAGSADHAGSAVVASAGSADHAGSAAHASAATPDKQVATPSGSSDQLQITSNPPGARVFMDGADQGTTPVKMAGSSDRHNIALLLPGHDLYVAEVDGHGQFSIELKPVTPSGGPAGIKVLKCKKDRYYVFVDGKPTGMLCPTERIHTSLGQHTVEVYDAVSESRQKFDINVPDDRLSARVRLE